jgi:NADPH:quinone reductase-like Zn-dependent oxidoreductase
MDFSGHVQSAGPSADAVFAPGTKVFGTIHPTSGLISGAGALAEYLITPSNLVQVVPPNVRPEEAAALGGLAQTALKMVETAGVAAGHRVLVHGASGGVGIAALQLATARGATVIATCSKRNMEMVKDAGADRVSRDLLFCRQIR